MVPQLLWIAGRLGMKYIVIPVAVTAATAFVLGGLVERVRRQKAAEGIPVEYQTHLEA
jgi:hypothetical protein